MGRIRKKMKVNSRKGENMKIKLHDNKKNDRVEQGRMR
jgi:hypothetical protein